MKVLLVIILIVLLFLVYKLFDREVRERVVSRVTGRDFTVNYDGDYADKEHAQRTLQEVVERILALRRHLAKKYGIKRPVDTIGDPMHDVDSLAGKRIDDDEGRIRPHVDPKIYEITQRLLTKFNPSSVHELSPFNRGGEAAFTEGKGSYIGLCIRDKSGKIYDVNSVMYVMLHEISHIGTKELDHQPVFWDNFKWILEEAIECGIYKPVNYKQNNMTYCGKAITFNPYYDW